jgi:hypothetical protein
MSRFPLLMLISIMLLAGCSAQSGTDGGGGGGGIGGGGNVDPDPSDQPSVGIPDQNSMSMSATEHNVNCFNTDGVTSTINVRLGDQLNNNDTIPDGTTVYFAAEGGVVESQCTTTNGVCSVTWTCQEFRPADGRVTILAWTEGTESFNDNNSNGFFDDVAPDTMIMATDRGEPFIDKNENGVRDDDEEFVNYPDPGLSTGGTYDGPDGLYSGPNCAYPGLCASNQSIFIWDEEIMVMSAGNFTGLIIPIMDTGTDYDVLTTFPIDVGTSPTVLFLIVDANGNALPKDTSIDFELIGDAGELPGTSSYTVGDTTQTAVNGPPWAYSDVSSLVYRLRIDNVPDNATGENGTLKVTAGDLTEEFFDIFDPMN